MQKNLLKFLAWPKTHGNNMKTPFLSSFCLSDLRTVHRFPPKNLVPEILNLLTLVVHNCTLEICCLLTQCVAYLSDVLPSRFGECDDVGMPCALCGGLALPSELCGSCTSQFYTDQSTALISVAAAQLSLDSELPFPA